MLPGKRVLGGHACPRLHVALGEVQHGRAVGVAVLRLEAVNGAHQIKRHDPVRMDELQRELRVRFIDLLPVRQAHRQELGVHVVAAQFLDGQLAQTAREQRVLSAADAKYVSPRPGCSQVVLEERGSIPHRFPGIDARGDF